MTFARASLFPENSTLQSTFLLQPHSFVYGMNFEAESCSVQRESADDQYKFPAHTQTHTHFWHIYDLSPLGCPVRNVTDCTSWPESKAF